MTDNKWFNVEITKKGCKDQKATTSRFILRVYQPSGLFIRNNSFIVFQTGSLFNLNLAHWDFRFKTGCLAPDVLKVIQAGLRLRPADHWSLSRSHTTEKLLNCIKTGLTECEDWVNSNKTVSQTIHGTWFDSPTPGWLSFPIMTLYPSSEPNYLTLLPNLSRKS